MFRPLFYIPSGKPVIAVRCSPILYKLWEGKQSSHKSSTPIPVTTPTPDVSASTSPTSTPAVPAEAIPTHDAPKADTPINEPSITPTPSPVPSPAPATPSRSFIKLDYRIVFAIATVDSVVVYDTQHLHPLAYMGDMHYANMTDVTCMSFLSSHACTHPI